jgi:hypothetical protein
VTDLRISPDDGPASGTGADSGLVSVLKGSRCRKWHTVGGEETKFPNVVGLAEKKGCTIPCAEEVSGPEARFLVGGWLLVPIAVDPLLAPDAGRLFPS